MTERGYPDLHDHLAALEKAGLLVTIDKPVIKRVAYEPLWTNHLKHDLGVQGVQRVVMHEPLINLRTFVFIQFDRGTPRTEVWRGLYGASVLMPQVGKFCVASTTISTPIAPMRCYGRFPTAATRSRTAMSCQIRSAATGPRPRSTARPPRCCSTRQ